MAECEYCHQEMTGEVGCTLTVFDDFPGGLPVGRLKHRAKNPCGGCGCPRGTYHHPGCDLERCPLCRGQALSCGCVPEEDDDDFVVPPLVTISPLVRFFGSANAPELEAFSYECELKNEHDEPVYAYKHCDTEWVLFLDDYGLPYRLCICGKELLSTSRTTALAMVYDGIDDDVFLSIPGSMPRYEIFPMQRNKPKSA